MGGTAANRLTSGGSGITGTTLGNSGGAETQTLSTAQLPAHQHAVFLKDPTHSHPYTAPSNILAGGAGSAASPSTTAGTTSAVSTGLTIGSVSGTANDNQTAAIGSGTAHNNTQPTFILNKIIKT